MRQFSTFLPIAIAAGLYISGGVSALAQAEYYEGAAFPPVSGGSVATPRVGVVVTVEGGRAEIDITVPIQTAAPLVAHFAGGGATEAVSLTAQSTTIYPGFATFWPTTAVTKYIASVPVPAGGGWRTVLDGNPPTVEVTGLGDATYVGSLRRIGRPEVGRTLIYSGTVRNEGGGILFYPSGSPSREQCVLLLDQAPGRKLASEMTAVLILYGSKDGQRYQRFGPRGQETSVERPAVLMKEGSQNRWVLAAGSVKRDIIAGTAATILTGRSADWNQPPRLLNGMWTSIVVEDGNLPIPIIDPEGIALSQLNLHLVSDPESANESFAGTVARIRANLTARGFIAKP